MKLQAPKTARPQAHLRTRGPARASEVPGIARSQKNVLPSFFVVMLVGYSYVIIKKNVNVII